MKYSRKKILKKRKRLNTVLVLISSKKNCAKFFGTQFKMAIFLSPAVTFNYLYQGNYIICFRELNSICRNIVLLYICRGWLQTSDSSLVLFKR